MKFTWKDFLFLAIPMVIILIIYPFLPAMVPRQFGLGGTVTYMPKYYLFALGLLPFIIHKYYTWKMKRYKH